LKKIGILALQGDFEKHKQVLKKINCDAIEVRTSVQMNQTDALIIPGGESTTFCKLFSELNLRHTIQEYAKNHPLMGTCAGLIVLAKKIEEFSSPSLNLLDITVKRNAYGRQRESFYEKIQLDLLGKKKEYFAVFIRAPRIVDYGKKIKVLAKYKDDAVMVMSENILASTFHPELTNDPIIHDFFIKSFL
jgi:5'-phosphate synthase pdxT subunit